MGALGSVSEALAQQVGLFAGAHTKVWGYEAKGKRAVEMEEGWARWAA